LQLVTQAKKLLSSSLRVPVEEMILEHESNTHSMT